MSIVVRKSPETSRMSPDSPKSEAHIFDEIRWGLSNQNNPIGRTCQLINQFHGPYGGSSGTLSNILNSMAGANSRLKKMSTNSKNSVDIVNEAINGITNVINTINSMTCSQMSTPFLRYFITECQVLHPDVTAYIQANIEQYPYFQQVSEQIGTHFTIISDCNMIDPLFTLQCGQLPIENLKTAARMVRPLFNKMFKPIAGNMEDSQKFLDTLYLRALPCEENHMYTHPNYGNESPIAHGNNFCMDVFHQQRAENAIPGVFGRLISIFGDRLRLLNQIFPVEYRIKHEEQIYEIPIEGQTLKVDRLNRPWPGRTSNNDRSLKADRETFNMGENV